MISADTQRSRQRFSDDAIVRLVHTFYARIREDDKLGPIFAAKIDDWPTHLDRMVGFWKAVLRAEPTFRPSPRGPPPVLHRQIDNLSQAHFTHWLAMFADVTGETFPPDEAADVLAAAQRIAVALSRHLPPAP